MGASSIVSAFQEGSRKKKRGGGGGGTARSSRRRLPVSQLHWKRKEAKGDLRDSCLAVSRSPRRRKKEAVSRSPDQQVRGPFRDKGEKERGRGGGGVVVGKKGGGGENPPPAFFGLKKKKRGEGIAASPCRRRSGATGILARSAAGPGAPRGGKSGTLEGLLLPGLIKKGKKKRKTPSITWAAFYPSVPQSLLSFSCATKRRGLPFSSPSRSSIFFFTDREEEGKERTRKSLSPAQCLSLQFGEGKGRVLLPASRPRPAAWRGPR